MEDKVITRKWDDGNGTGFNVCFSFVDSDSVLFKVVEINNKVVVGADTYTLRADTNTCVDLKMFREGNTAKGELRFTADFGNGDTFVNTLSLGLGGIASDFDLKLSQKLGSSHLNPSVSTCGLIGGQDVRGNAFVTKYISANLNWADGSVVRIHYLKDRSNTPTIRFSSTADIIKVDASGRVKIGDIAVPWWDCAMDVSH